MKVLVVSHLYPYPGVNRHLFVHEQCRALRDLGVEVRVISPTPWTPRVLQLTPRLRRRGGKPPSAIRDGIAADYPRFLQPPRRIVFDRLGDLAYRRVRLLPCLQQERFDLIHAHQALPDGAIAEHLAHDLGVPFVVTMHGTDVHQGLSGGGAVAKRIAAVLRSAAAVVVVSPTLARKLAARVTLATARVVPNGGPTDTSAAVPADFLPGRSVVLSAGRLVPGKGFEHVLEAAARLGDAHGDVVVAIAGDGDQRRRLESLAADLGLGDRTRFLGHLEPHDLMRMMARADVFALPSAPEGFGLVHLEAMTQGTPVIACRDEGPADFLEDGVSGYLVPYGDVAELTKVLSRALDDPAHAASVGEAGRAVSRSFTWKRNAGRMLEIYTQVAGGDRA